PYQPRNDPNYTDPSPAEIAARVQSLTAAVSAPMPETRSCIQVRRTGGSWMLSAKASQGLGGLRVVRWRHRGWNARGRGLRVALRPAGHNPARRVSLIVRDRYGRRARVSARLSPRLAGRERCRS